MSAAKDDTLFGHHAVRAALRYEPANVVEAWLDSGRRDRRVQHLRERLEHLGCPIHTADRRTLDRLSDGGTHQGVVVRYRGARPRGDGELADLLEGLTVPPLLLALDQVQDPHNLGACLRTADAAGVHAVIAPRDRAAGLTPVVHKVAAGAASRVAFFQVTNLARTLRGLRERGVWLVGSAESAGTSLYDADLDGPLTLVLGAEDSGMRRLTRDVCDRLVHIPMADGVESLNVSVATGVVLFEAIRQRRVPA